MSAAVERAIGDLIGVPYSAGAWGPEAYDCFTLVAEVYRRLGIPLALSRLLTDAVVDERSIELADLLEEEWETVPIPREVGDIALIRAPLRSDPEAVPKGSAGHCAVHLGGHRMLHTTEPHGAHIVSWRLLRPVTLRVVRLRARLGAEVG